MVATVVQIILVALLHLYYFLVLEMFLFTRTENMKVLAANQGLCNGFLAAGFVWGPALLALIALVIGL